MNLDREPVTEWALRQLRGLFASGALIAQSDQRAAGCLDRAVSQSILQGVSGWTMMTYYWFVRGSSCIYDRCRTGTAH